MQNLHSARVLQRASLLQNIPSPTGMEAERAELALAWMRELELADCHLDGAGNACGRIAGSLPSEDLVVFSAHLDTVFPLSTRLDLSEGTDTLSGPGIGDNCLGVAALIEIPSLLEANGLHPKGDVWLCATVGEEGLGNLKGTWQLIERFGSRMKAYISLEGVGLGIITHKGLAVERLRLHAGAAGGHAWSDRGNPSAIHGLVTCAAELLRRLPPAGAASSFNIGIIEGGSSINTLASTAQMDIDLRSETAEDLQAMRRILDQVIQASGQEGVVLNVEEIGSRPGGALPPSHWLVKAAWQALEAAGIDPRLDGSSTEANAPLSRGIPAITLGLTRGSGVHSLDERIETPPIAQGLAQLVELCRLIL